jgi:hypothetical protein
LFGFKNTDASFELKRLCNANKNFVGTTPKIKTYIFVENDNLDRNFISITENISIVFQLFLSLTVETLFIKKADFSEFRI